MAKKTKYLIIGNSAAGINAVESIRSADAAGSIAIVSDEPCKAYSRPLISYFLGKKISEDKMFYRNEGFYEENGVELILGSKASKLDAGSRTVALKGGRTVEFEKLLVSTGGKPIIPPGIEAEDGAFTFLTLDDAKKIRSYISAKKARGAAVIGGGLIGLKATEGLLELGIKVTIVELADRVLSATFDKTASGIIENALKKTGCYITTGDTVVKINRKGRKPESVTLKTGGRIKCDMVILAIGVTPNLDLVKDTAVRTEKGILVDSFMQTSVNGIFAAGDVAQVRDIISGKTRTIAIWPNATKQGKVAGLNMAGVKTAYDGALAMNSVELGGIPTISMGLTEPPDGTYTVVSEHNEQANEYRKIVLKDNVITGAVFVNRIDRAGVFTGLIKDRINTSDFREHLLSDDFGLIHLPKEYRKHLVTGPGIEI